MIKNFSKIFMLILLLASCGKEEETPQPQKPEEKVAAKVELQKASFAEIGNWNKDNIAEAYHAFELTCKRLSSQKSEFLGSAEIKIKTADYLKICKKLPVQKQNFRKFLEDNFEPHLVTYDGSPEGKFTSYYEAEIKASRQKSAQYNVPIYGRPNDLIEFNPQDFDKSMPSKRLVGRVKDKKLIPYYNRDEITARTLDAPVILWGDSYVDIYVMQIQGSAVAKLDDGSEVRVGFADTNGRDFKGIGSILLENKVIEPGQASMGKIKLWLKANPQIANDYLDKNQRYIFHRIIEAEGPLGALGVPLSSGRSMAVDKSFVPLGSLLWLETTGPNREKIEKLVVAQDIGGAIKGAVRGDYFWGSGGDDVLDLAGKMHAKGRYFILMPKQEAK